MSVNKTSPAKQRYILATAVRSNGNSSQLKKSLCSTNNIAHDIVKQKAINKETHGNLLIDNTRRIINVNKSSEVNKNHLENIRTKDDTNFCHTGLSPSLLAKIKEKHKLPRKSLNRRHSFSRLPLKMIVSKMATRNQERQPVNDENQLDLMRIRNLPQEPPFRKNSKSERHMQLSEFDKIVLAMKQKASVMCDPSSQHMSLENLSEAEKEMLAKVVSSKSTPRDILYTPQQRYNYNQLYGRHDSHGSNLLDEDPLGANLSQSSPPDSSSPSHGRIGELPKRLHIKSIENHRTINTESAGSSSSKADQYVSDSLGSHSNIVENTVRQTPQTKETRKSVHFSNENIIYPPSDHITLSQTLEVENSFEWNPVMVRERTKTQLFSYLDENSGSDNRPSFLDSNNWDSSSTSSGTTVAEESFQIMLFSNTANLPNITSEFLKRYFGSNEGA